MYARRRRYRSRFRRRSSRYRRSIRRGPVRSFRVRPSAASRLSRYGFGRVGRREPSDKSGRSFLGWKLRNDTRSWGDYLRDFNDHASRFRPKGMKPIGVSDREWKKISRDVKPYFQAAQYAYDAWKWWERVSEPYVGTDLF